MLTNPRYQMQEIGLTELVGKDEQVDQNDYSGSVAITLGDGVRPVSGEFLAFAFYATEENAGAVQDSAGTLLLLDADPAVSSGDTALTAAEWKTVLGRVDVEAGDWITDANGGLAYIFANPIPFHNLQTIYAVWLHTDATGLNDGGTDDEVLEFNAWYRRDT
ncbi:MAG: hypothetical protein P8Y93_09210 [Acidobacteriota bacterium]